MAENPEPPAPATTPGSSELPPPTSQPRRRLVTDRPVRLSSSELSEQVADLTDTVRALAQHVTGEATVNPAEAGAERGSRRRMKFTRSGLPDERPTPLSAGPATDDTAREEANSASATGETNKTEGANFNRNVAWPRAGQAEAAELAAVRPPRRNRARKKLILLMMIQGVGLALLVVGYLLGRSDAPGTGTNADSNLPAIPPDPDEVNVDVGVSERNLAAIGAALHTARTGNKKEAARLLEELGKKAVVPGLQYQLGRLAFEQDDLLTGDKNFDLSRHAGEYYAASCYAQAWEYALQGHQDAILRQFTAAIHAEPFNGRYFFYYAEVLRREGRIQKAIEAFEGARDRPHTGPEESLYLFKECLAKVEGGNDAAFNAELEEHLKEQPPRPEWLMLAAARCINARDLPAAAGFLKRAAGATPPALYNLWTKDFVFRTVSEQPALAELLQRPPVAGSTEEFKGFIDPTVGAPELLDPGIWPVGRR